MRQMMSRESGLIAGVAALALVVAAGGYLAGQQSRPDKAEAATEAAAQPAESKSETDDSVIALTDAQVAAVGIEVVAVRRGGGSETRLSGRVQPMTDAKAAITTTLAGTVERLLVAPGQAVRAGQPIATVVSGEGAALRADTEAAAAAATAARQAHQRNISLAELGVVARQEVESSQAQAASAGALARAARARASAAGSPSASGRASVTSPISGVITNVLVGPGGFLSQGAVVAEVTNPDRVELVFNAPPALASQIRSGSVIKVTGPTGEFDARVVGVAAGADLQNSGATVVRAQPVGAGLLPAGSTVTASVVTNADQGGAITVPSEAVQTVDGATVVFIRTRAGFRAQYVLVGNYAAGQTEILRGLTGNELVASTNAFLLKAEMARGEAEHGH